MKKTLLTTSLLAFLMVISYVTVQAQGYIFTEPADTVTVLEAEHYFELRESANFDDWSESTALAGFTGSGYMVAPPNNSYGDGAIAQADAPAIRYRINFTSPGTHYFFFRCSYADGASDSYWLEVDDTILVRMNPYTEIVENFDMWGWSASTTTGQFEFPIGTAGEHDIVVYVREPNFRLDKIVLTKDPNAGPSGFNENGPAETAFTTGIEDNFLSSSLNVYPNPASDFATISFDVQQAGQANVSVMNIQGQKVATLMDGTVAAGTQKINWNFADDSTIASGIYFVKIEHAGKTALQKIVVK